MPPKISNDLIGIDVLSLLCLLLYALFKLCKCFITGYIVCQARIDIGLEHRRLRILGQIASVHQRVTIRVCVARLPLMLLRACVVVIVLFPIVLLLTSHLIIRRLRQKLGPVTVSLHVTIIFFILIILVRIFLLRVRLQLKATVIGHARLFGKGALPSLPLAISRLRLLEGLDFFGDLTRFSRFLIISHG